MVLWIFGYASLIWKAGFDYDERVLGYIKGYKRAFHLACFEHRGTYELPARVAMLESDEDAVCWGYAYCIKSVEKAEKAMQYLTVRESEYDLIKVLEFFTEGSTDKPEIEVQVFMSTTDSKLNKYYLGFAPRGDMALQIARTTGPSGPNCDYLFRLVEALRDLGHEDPEIVKLANAVRKILCELQVHGQTAQNLSSKTHVLLSAVTQGSPPLLPQLNTGVSFIDLGSLSLSHTPCSPRLLKSRAL